ncbi:MAG: DegV family protein [Faecalibacterium sp.]|jgi:DegV family protein with EDD domain|nr:DegV family protein [Faecalibacterium sp.]
MVQILADSACDLSQEEAAALQVQLIPLHVTLETGEVLRDGIDTDAAVFFPHLASCKKLPTTSQPSPDLFAEAFDRAKAEDKEVVAVLLSSELSGTFQSASIGASMSDYEKVHLIDSGTASIGEGLLVRLACALRDKGLDAEHIAAALVAAKRHLHVIAVIDDLKFLRKGGRLPAAVAVAGGMLGIKPLVTIKDGKVAMAGKARGLPGAYVAVFKVLEAAGGPAPESPCVGGYTTGLSQMEPIQRYIHKEYPDATLLLDTIGCVIGTHGGPGAFALAFFDGKPDAQAPDKG